jgi:hypothetical protein
MRERGEDRGLLLWPGKRQSGLAGGFIGGIWGLTPRYLFANIERVGFGAVVSAILYVTSVLVLLARTAVGMAEDMEAAYRRRPDTVGVVGRGGYDSFLCRRAAGLYGPRYSE